MTGDNPGLAARLNIEFYKRVGTGFVDNKLWFEAGYCIDAPDIMPAGSTCWDIYGFDMPTFAKRESSNAQAKGRAAFCPSRLHAVLCVEGL